MAYVERNQEVRIQQADCTQQTDLPPGLWGLERTTLREWNRNDIYSYDTANCTSSHVFLISVPSSDGTGISYLKQFNTDLWRHHANISINSKKYVYILL